MELSVHIWSVHMELISEWDPLCAEPYVFINRKDEPFNKENK